MEIMQIECGKCKELIDVKWNNGVVTEPHFVLIADWVYHTKCWDQIVFEHSYPDSEDITLPTYQVTGDRPHFIIVDEVVNDPLDWDTFK